ncbi:MAG: helix-turn-helix transcriptional regulator [Firmicutes bacterium]|nr:helix-turn-helix transcriptional regulator [Bacillota bacterium]
MLKDYLKQSGKSIYAVAKDSGLPYSTLNDLANGKVQIDQCRVGLLRSLAHALSLSLEDTCALCSGQFPAVHTSYPVDARITVRNKTFYAEFEYVGEPVTLRLCRVNENTRYYIGQIAQWRTEEYIRGRRLQEFQ